jgi:hypothetical protein
VWVLGLEECGFVVYIFRLLVCVRCYDATVLCCFLKLILYNVPQGSRINGHADHFCQDSARLPLL